MDETAVKTHSRPMLRRNCDHKESRDGTKVPKPIHMSYDGPISVNQDDWTQDV